MEDTGYVKTVCPAGATNCTEGWSGGDYNSWHTDDDDRLWKQSTSNTSSSSSSSSSKRKKRSSDPSPTPLMIGPLAVPQFASGAGVQLGLTVMLFANKNKYFLTSAFYEGFKLLVHHPEDFAEVREKGFVVGPGQEMFVSLGAQGDELCTFDCLVYTCGPCCRCLQHRGYQRHQGGEEKVLLS